MLSILHAKFVPMFARWDTPAYTIAAELAILAGYTVEWNINNPMMHCKFEYYTIAQALQETAYYMGAIVTYDHDNKEVFFNPDPDLKYHDAR